MGNSCQLYLKTENIQPSPSSYIKDEPTGKNSMKYAQLSTNESSYTITQDSFFPTPDCFERRYSYTYALFPQGINIIEYVKIYRIQAAFRRYLSTKEEKKKKEDYDNRISIKTSEVSKYDHRLVEVIQHLRSKYTVVSPSKMLKHSKEGLCYLRWSDCSYLKGIYKDNKLNGYGNIKLHSNKQYSGEFVDNKLNGYGIFYQSNWLHIEGEWIKGKLEGIVFERFEDGTIFKGIYKNGYRNGIGTYLFPDTCIYEGQFVNHKMNGVGIIQYQNGNYYEGQFCDNLFHSYGEYYWATGEKYLGYWNKGSRDSFGIYINQTEYIAYIGYWKKNKQHGHGILYSIKKRQTPSFGQWSFGIKKIAYKTFNAFINSYFDLKSYSPDIRNLFLSSNEKAKYLFT